MDEAIVNYRECRDWRHFWEPWRAWRIKGNAGFVEQRRCVHCGSIAERVLDRNGYQVSRTIKHYAEGYVRKGQGRLSEEDRAELRLAGARDAAKREQPSE